MDTPDRDAPPTAEPPARDGAYQKLKSAILENRLSPGFHAAEIELAQRFGVSRTPVREALIRLQGEGLVELIPRRGARVLPVSPNDMREIYEILTALEPEAAASVASRRLSAEALAPLTSATDAMEAALADGDLNAWAAADDRFHRRLLGLHANRRLEGIVTTLFDQAHRARMVTLWMRKAPVESTRAHRETLEAILAGDVDGARSVFRTHRETAAVELTALLERSRLAAF